MVDGGIEYDGLDEDDIKSWLRRPISKVYPHIRGGLFHRTSIVGYRGIREAGHISPNTGQFPFTYAKSEIFWGYARGYVSVFDFGPTTDQECVRRHVVWGPFFFDQQPVTIVLRLNREMLKDKLIPNSAAPQSGPDAWRYIPHVEAWYPEDIPFEAIEGLIFTKSRGHRRAPMFKELHKDAVNRFEEELRIVLIEEIRYLAGDIKRHSR